MYVCMYVYIYIYIYMYTYCCLACSRVVLFVSLVLTGVGCCCRWCLLLSRGFADNPKP